VWTLAVKEKSEPQATNLKQKPRNGTLVKYEKKVNKSPG